MLSLKRRIAPDERARVPFAVLAVMIFLLSSFSVAYLGATTRQEIVNRLLRSDLRAVEEILAQLQSELQSGVHFVGEKTVSKVLKEVNSPDRIREPIQIEIVNTTFQAILDDYLFHQFPTCSRGHCVELWEHKITLLPKLERVIDLIANRAVALQNIDDYDVGNFSKIDVVQQYAYGATNTTRSYLAMGYLNVTVSNRETNLKSNRTLWVTTEIDSPLPFLFRKMEAFQSSALGGLSELSRLTNYILTTIAQFKAFQGVGMKDDGLPEQLSEYFGVVAGDSTDVLTLKDVELAINLAILLLSAKEFRAWDDETVRVIDNQTHLPALELSDLLQKFENGGTIDAADLICLYLGLGSTDGEGINLEVILAQAMYGVLDQFILKYLDYTGIMPLVDAAWRGVQSVDGILQLAGDAIQDIWDWVTGSTSLSWHEVLRDWLVQKMVTDGGLEGDYFLHLLVGDRRDSKYGTYRGEVIDSYPVIDIQEGGFALEFVVRQTDEYHTWYSNGSEDDHRGWLSIDDEVVGHDTIIFTVEVNFDSPGHQIVFEEVDIAERVDQSDVWQDFFEGYFSGDDPEESTVESLRESVKEMVLDIAQDALRRIGALVDNQRYLTEVNPYDRTPFLDGLGATIESAMDEIVDFYKSPEGMEEVKKILASHTNGDLGLLEDLKFFLAMEYDSFVDYPAVLLTATELVTAAVMENHMSFVTSNVELLENSDISYDWSHDGNVSEDSLPPGEIRRVFLEGGVRSRERFSDLHSALLDDVDIAYQELKSREVGIGVDPEDKGVLTQAIETAEEKASQDFMSMFVGGAVDFLDGIGFLDMAFKAVDDFIEGMVDGSEASNVQYILPLMVGEPFVFWEGDYRFASEMDTVTEVSFQVDQLQDYLHAYWYNIDSSTAAPDGALYVDFSSKGSKDRDTGYDSSDIKGKHYTDIMSFSERPFETKWNLTVLGSVPIHLRTNERTLLGPGGHQPIWLNRSIEINLSTTIVVHTGWELEGVDYDITNSALADIVDFLNNIWETLKDPLMDILDYYQILSDFLREVLRTLLEYGSQAIQIFAETTDFAISLLQSFLSKVLSVASGHLMDFLRNFGLEHFFIEFAGLTVEVKIAEGKERADCQCRLWMRATGYDMDFTAYLIEFEEPVDGFEQYIVVEGKLSFGSRGTANVTIDPFILLHQYLIEIHAIDLNARGDGWALDIHSPELEIYRNSGIALSDVVGFTPTIPIPFLGVEVGIDLGISVKYSAPTSPVFDVRLVLYELLKESLGETWQELGIPLSLDALSAFIKAVVQKFIDKVIWTFGDIILEVVFFLDLAFSAIGSGGAVGGGIQVGFVVDRTVLFELLRWLIDSVEAFVHNLHDPFDPAPYPTLPSGLPEYLDIRFEVYFGVKYPKMLRSVASQDSTKKMDLSITVQPNVPALVMLAGIDWGKWRIDFGAYLENFPLSSLSKVESISKESIVDLYLLKGQICEVIES